MFCAHDDYDLHLDDVVSDRFYIAVDIGGTKIASAIVRMSYGTYEVIDKNRMPTCAQKGGDDVLYRLVSMGALLLQPTSCQAGQASMWHRQFMKVI